MLKITKKIAPSWFALPDHPDPVPEFLLAPLTAVAWIDVRNQITTTGQGALSISGKGALGAVTSSVRGWRNVFDDSGNPIEFTPALLEQLGRKTLLQVASEIVDRAYLAEEEEKNS